MAKFKKALNVFSTVMLVLFVLFVVLLVGVRIIGLDPYIVLSGSMEPEIYTGSLVYVDLTTPEEACNLKPGDTVTYLVNNGGTRVTHKIYEVVGPLYVKNQYGELITDENGDYVVAKDDKGYPIIMYTTYGINNINPSDPSGYTLDGIPGEGNLASSNVLGKPVFSIPLLGYVSHFVQNPPGKYISLVICVILILAPFFFDSDGKEKPSADAAEDKSSENESDANTADVSAEKSE